MQVCPPAPFSPSSSPTDVGSPWWGWQDARRQEIEAKRQRLVDLRRAREERRALLESERTGSTAASGANVRLFLLLLFLPGGSREEEQVRADSLALTFPLTTPKASSRLPSSSIKEGRSRLPSQLAPWSNTFLAIPSGVKPELDGCQHRWREVGGGVGAWDSF